MVPIIFFFYLKKKYMCLIKRKNQVVIKLWKVKNKISPLPPPNPLIFHRGKHSYEFGASSSKTQPHDVCVLCHSVEIYQSTPPRSPRLICCSLPQNSHYYLTYLMSVFKILPYLSASIYWLFRVLCAVYSTLCDARVRAFKMRTTWYQPLVLGILLQ